MISLLLFATLLELTWATYPPYTTGGTYLPYTTGGIQSIGFQTFPYSTGGIGNLGLQTYFPSTYNTFGNGYYPSYLFNTASYPTVVSHYLYFPAGNPWEPGRNYIDLRVNPYPWYLVYYGGLGTGLGSTTFPGTYETFGNSLGYPAGTGSGGSLTNGLTGLQLDPSYTALTGSLGLGNFGFPGYGSGGYYPTGNIGGHIHRKKIY